MAKISGRIKFWQRGASAGSGSPEEAQPWTRLIRNSESLLLRPDSEYAKRFLRANADYADRLASLAGSPERITSELTAVEKLTQDFGLVQRHEVERLISDLGEAVSDTLQQFENSITGGENRKADLDSVKKTMLRAQSSESIDEVRRLLKEGIVGLTRIAEQEAHRMGVLREEYEAHVQSLAACLDQARTEGRTDPLTHLPNRRSFEERAQEIHQGLVKNREGYSLAILDLDGFKRLNDTLGHAAGDCALAAFAKRLRSAVGDAPFIARLGGDEFIVLAAMSVTILEGLLQHLDVSLQNHPCHYGAQALKFRVTFGLTTFDAARSVTQILSEADARLYAAKSERRTRRAA